MADVAVWMRVGDGEEHQVGTCAGQDEVPRLLRMVADEMDARMNPPDAAADGAG